ncbi:hypothetical protein E2C01_062434 [Portunus trituberculatus]|uniref:Uncharacterized protein n=1 Tax=Portunus trituberculatus TaxID=210409 RepID=A0A5B7HG22_PORTR|nr:hypothetical protein [Portunus trituberculatus]
MLISRRRPEAAATPDNGPKLDPTLCSEWPRPPLLRSLPQPPSLLLPPPLALPPPAFPRRLTRAALPRKNTARTLAATGTLRWYHRQAATWGRRRSQGGMMRWWGDYTHDNTTYASCYAESLENTGV